MKTSSKLIIVAVLAILIAMMVYDMQIKTAYFNGDYRGNTKNFVHLDFKNFNSIALNSSTAINILLKQGPFNVQVDPACRHFVKISQSGETLSISAAFTGEFESYQAPYVLVISCPRLTGIVTDARYMAGTSPITDMLASDDFQWRPTLVQGFTLDSLFVREDHASNLVFSGNHIKYLHAVTAISAGSRANLKLDSGNTFEQVNIQAMNRSQLWLNNSAILNIKYEPSDSSKLILTGALQKIVNHTLN